MSALQVYIGPDLEGTMHWISGLWQLPIADIRRLAADGLLTAVMQGWQLQPGQFWEDQVLLLLPMQEHTGWYNVVEVARL